MLVMFAVAALLVGKSFHLLGVSAFGSALVRCLVWLAQFAAVRLDKRPWSSPAPGALWSFRAQPHASL